MDPNAMTVRLARGKHASPESGACVMELASMLSGEPFCDHPRSVCPVIAAFLRVYNDELCDHDRPALLAYASSTIGTSGGRSLRRWRHGRLLAWMHPGWSTRRIALAARLRPSSLTAQDAALHAARMHASRRGPAVDALLEALVRGPGAAPRAVDGELEWAARATPEEISG
jgi:hypothetical protein